MDIVREDRTVATNGVPVPIWGPDIAIGFNTSKIYLVDQRTNITEFEKSESLIEMAHQMHNDFENGRRGKSFHNIDHIKAVEQAVDAVLQKIDTDDPFGLNTALSSWNATRPPNLQVTQVEMGMAIKIATATHDLGNIIDSVGFTDNGFAPRFNKNYKSQGAEERSKQIVRTLMTGSEFSKKTLDRVVPLVEYLIGETTYDYNQTTVGFATFMRVVDQIGNALYNPTDYANNLLHEMLAENPKAEFTPYDHFNFPNTRFEYLVPNKEKRNRILETWNKRMPKVDENLTRERIKISEYLALDFNSNGRTH